ncbi:hypothetical protein [Pantoea dispersa]|uniref:hypothetical protein n=1 Tax=Pantoea dispersa TaxID=59814 RepID=UPI0021ADD42E|nr:hypothetical protein [Pantoea dispersa]
MPENPAGYRHARPESDLFNKAVNSIRDDATALSLDSETALAMAESRGYRDIDPKNCWAEWLAFRSDK